VKVYFNPDRDPEDDDALLVQFEGDPNLEEFPIEVITADGWERLGD
jgi:hypothetical protein